MVSLWNNMAMNEGSTSYDIMKEFTMWLVNSMNFSKYLHFFVSIILDYKIDRSMSLEYTLTFSSLV